MPIRVLLCCCWLIVAFLVLAVAVDVAMGCITTAAPLTAFAVAVTTVWLLFCIFLLFAHLIAVIALAVTACCIATAVGNPLWCCATTPARVCHCHMLLISPLCRLIVLWNNNSILLLWSWLICCSIETPILLKASLLFFSKCPFLCCCSTLLPPLWPLCHDAIIVDAEIAPLPTTMLLPSATLLHCILVMLLLVIAIAHCYCILDPLNFLSPHYQFFFTFIFITHLLSTILRHNNTACFAYTQHSTGIDGDSNSQW